MVARSPGTRSSSRRTKPLGLLLLMMLLLCLSACRRVDPVVKIGLVGPFEGKSRAIGYDVIYSARLAVREINAAGGVAGYRVGLAALDDAGDPELAAAAAESLVIDPAVVAVVGHWSQAADAAAAPIYQNAGLSLIAAGRPPFAPVEPDSLPDRFRQAYRQVTPFDEVAGPLAAPAYDAFQLLWLAFDRAAAEDGAIDRSTVYQALSGLEYEGLAGLVYRQDVITHE